MAKNKKEYIPIYICGDGEHSDKFMTIEALPEKLLSNYDEYVKYVKGCEAMVRDDDRYTAYIAKLKSGGFDTCAVMGKLPTDNKKIKIEMHHGPIFNLFDYCDIVLKALLKDGRKDITTPKIADIILDEHEADTIMVVMLSKFVHKGGAHNLKSYKGLFVDIKSTFGRIDRFIDKWSRGMESEHYQYIEKYMKECKKASGKTLDNGLFDVADRLKNFHEKNNNE